MAALTAITPTHNGATSAGAAVAASDTITGAQLGSRGALLEILNGNASPDSMTISDAGSTPGGTAPATYAGSVTNATNKIFYIHPSQADSTTGLVTVTHSVTTTVTYKLYPLG